ncbi:zinc finger protein 32-like [Macrosteles quadrilineatus]|uniref:zinc finger protein 32-like n=1 Tax=Macrosteles quadrilineatus TaxID=74068 RepID=UPI0023E23104|nr:zinc finger protein 32-like [Macrosteles quadrilineatus]
MTVKTGWVRFKMEFCRSYIVVEGKETDRFQCLACNKIYKGKGNLIKHQRYECGDKRPFACTLCSYSAKQKNNLKLHMFNKHQIANFK